MLLVLLLLRQCSGHPSSPLLEGSVCRSPVLPADALQQAVDFTVRVDAISQPCANPFEGLGLPVRVVGCEAFNFEVKLIEGNDFLVADLTSVLDHLLN